MGDARCSLQPKPPGHLASGIVVFVVVVVVVLLILLLGCDVQ